MNAANIITIIRFVLIPFFVFFAMSEGKLCLFIAALIFALASITDKLDGYIAKKFNLITDLGKIMDPLADKLLVFSALVIFVKDGLMHPVALLLILARELTITSIRVVVASAPGGKVVGAAFSGKLKTAVSIAAILVILVTPLLPVIGIDFLEPHYVLISNVLSWIIAAITVISGIDYCFHSLSLKSLKNKHGQG